MWECSIARAVLIICGGIRRPRGHNPGNTTNRGATKTRLPNNKSKIQTQQREIQTHELADY
jgi:hypothetical protein